jgi:hypothetical protein
MKNDSVHVIPPSTRHTSAAAPRTSRAEPVINKKATMSDIRFLSAALLYLHPGQFPIKKMDGMRQEPVKKVRPTPADRVGCRGDEVILTFS